MLSAKQKGVSRRPEQKARAMLGMGGGSSPGGKGWKGSGQGGVAHAREVPVVPVGGRGRAGYEKYQHLTDLSFFT